MYIEVSQDVHQVSLADFSTLLLVLTIVTCSATRGFANDATSKDSERTKQLADSATITFMHGL
jgi:hypothetical protein